MTQRVEVFFFNMTQRIEPILFSSMTQRIDFFWTFFSFWSMTQRIEFFEQKNDSQNFFLTKIRIRLTELNLFSLIWLIFFKKSQIIEFSVWLKELNLLLWTSFQYDSKRWSFFFFSFWLKEMNFFQYDAKIFSNWLKRVEPTFFHDSKKWPCFSKMTHRIEPLFWIWRKEWNPFFFEYDAKNWTLLSLNTSQRIEFFCLWIRRKELNPFSLNMTQRIESFV